MSMGDDDSDDSEEERPIKNLYKKETVVFDLSSDEDEDTKGEVPEDEKKVVVNEEDKEESAIVRVRRRSLSYQYNQILNEGPINTSPNLGNRSLVQSNVSVKEKSRIEITPHVNLRGDEEGEQEHVRATTISVTEPPVEADVVIDSTATPNQGDEEREREVPKVSVSISLPTMKRPGSAKIYRGEERRGIDARELQVIDFQKRSLAPNVFDRLHTNAEERNNERGKTD